MFDVHVGWNVDRKERKKEEIIFKTNVLVPREEGATVAATPTFSLLSGQLRFVVGPVGQRSTMEFSKPSGKPH